MNPTITESLLGTAQQARDRALAAIERVREIHQPFGVYDECEHEHTESQLEAGECLEVDEVGLTCENGLLYEICTECCTDDLGWTRQQREGCADSHGHEKGKPICKTVAALEEDA